MTISEANQQLLLGLYKNYDRREAANITDWLMESLTGLKKIDRIVNTGHILTDGNESTLGRWLQEIEKQKPVQYILHESWFCGLKLYVDENVLIPRPETEELVEWITNATGGSSLKVLDIGTGSGCIPVALKIKSPALEIGCCDISAAALEVASKNASIHHAELSFYHLDILDHEQWNMLPVVDIIVSNPPYIPISQRNEMNRNVLDHEPALALFVENEDPLVFYKAISLLAASKLTTGGSIFVEIHEDHATATAAVFKQAGFGTVEIRNDMQGKPRMIRAY